jgi:hypothetical protein
MLTIALVAHWFHQFNMILSVHIAQLYLLDTLRITQLCRGDELNEGESKQTHNWFQLQPVGGLTPRSGCGRLRHRQD